MLNGTGTCARVQTGLTRTLLLSEPAIVDRGSGQPRDILCKEREQKPGECAQGFPSKLPAYRPGGSRCREAVQGEGSAIAATPARQSPTCAGYVQSTHPWPPLCPTLTLRLWAAFCADEPPRRSVHIGTILSRRMAVC